MLGSSVFPALELGGTGNGATSWTNVVIIYNKNHNLFMAESRLSRFQTAKKAKLPDAAFFSFLLLNTRCSAFESPDKERR